MLPDKRAEVAREVDIVAEATIGGYAFFLCVEVVDERRKANVNWVERMAQKHADLPTSKLALWSRSGFSKPAINKALKLNIATVTPETIEVAPWARIARAVVKGSVKFVRPNFDRPAVDVEIGGKKERWTACPDMKLEEPETGQTGLLSTILMQIEQSPMLGSKLLDHAPTGAGAFHVAFVPKRPLDAIRDDGTRGRVFRVLIGISTITEVVTTIAGSAVRTDQATTLIEAEFAHGRFSVVVNEPKDGQPSVRAGYKRKAGASEKTKPRRK
ncbi:MAG: hypothetical protein ABIP94_19420 [Planctomycetota bacterium]